MVTNYISPAPKSVRVKVCWGFSRFGRLCSVKKREAELMEVPQTLT